MKKISFGFIGIFLAFGCSGTRFASSALEVSALAGFSGVVVLVSDYTTTAQVHFIRNDKVNLGAVPVHRDARIRWDSATSRLYVIQRMGADSFFYFDLLTGNRVSEISVQRGKNIQDLIPTGRRTAWVTALDSSGAVEVDLASGAEIRTVSLRPEQVDADGFSEPTFLVNEGDWFAATFQRLSNYSVQNEAWLVRWLMEGTVGVFPLRYRNPVTELKKSDQGYFVGGAGVIGNYSDGGIEQLHGQSLEPQKSIISEAALGGDVVDFEILSDTYAFALISTPESKLVAFNPSTGTLIASVGAVTAPAYTFVQVKWDSVSERLLLTDQDKQNPRVRVFNRNLVEKVEEAIELTLPPIQILKI
jgi:hypothetical protein